MKVIILAAGMSSRLYPLSLEKPKCLLLVQGKTIIDRQIEVLDKAGIQDILIVVGYKKEVIQKLVGDRVRYRDYGNFHITNNLNTLWSVRDEFNTDCILLFSDILFENDILNNLIQSKDDICMAIDTSKVLSGTMRIVINDGKLSSIGSQIHVDEASGNFIGMAKFSKHGTSLVLKQMKKMIHSHRQDYYTIAIDSLIKRGKEIGFVDVANQYWAEIDTKEDLEEVRRRYS